MELCKNCDLEKATIQCINCPKDESLLCKKCWKIHKQVKIYKNHESIKLIHNVICSNCEIKNAQFQCRQCPKSESLFCKECSQIHTQVKVFRDHNFMPLEITESHEPEMEVIHQSSSISKFIDFLFSQFLYLFKYFEFNEAPNEFFRWIPDSIGDIFGTSIDYKTVSFGLVIAFISHILIKLLFGKHSVYIIIAVGILAVRWLKRSQYLLTEEVKKIEKKNHLVIDEMKSLRSKNLFSNDILDQEDLKSEFWHDTGSERSTNSLIPGFGDSQQIFAPKFKPRGQLYTGRRSIQKETLEDQPNSPKTTL